MMVTKEALVAAAHQHVLSSDELFHLHDLAFGGLMQKRLPDQIKTSLMERGLIENRIGGEVIVDNGWSALMAHKAIGKLK